jgi:hypothetical protein
VSLEFSLELVIDVADFFLVLFVVWILASPCFLFSLTKAHSGQHQGFDFSSHKKNACPVLFPLGVRATQFFTSAPSPALIFLSCSPCRLLLSPGVWFFLAAVCCFILVFDLRARETAL